MNPAKTIADQAEAALRLFFTDSREEAARLLEMYGPLVAMFEQDVDAAVEVRSLVLDRFPAAEPPNVPGLDWLPAVEADAAVLVAEAVAVLDEPVFCTDVYRGNEGEFKCDRPAGHGDHHWHLLAEFGWPVEVPAVLDEPKAGSRWRDRDGDVWVVQADGRLLLTQHGDQLGEIPCDFTQINCNAGPLVEVPAPVKELPSDDDGLTECTCQVSNNPPCAWCENDGGES